MVRILLQVVLNAAGLLLAARIVPGIDYHGDIVSLVIAGLVLGIINLIVKPIVKVVGTVLSLPLILVTIGLFYFVLSLAINGLMLMLADALLPALEVQGCMPAILGGVVLGIVNWFVGLFTREDREKA